MFQGGDRDRSVLRMRRADADNVALRVLHHCFDAVECTHPVLVAEGVRSIERSAAYGDEFRFLEIRQRTGMEMTDLSAADNGRSEFLHGGSL